MLRPSEGRISSANMTTPIPPIHVEDMRQNCSPRGSTSISFRIVDPVVVKPEDEEPVELPVDGETTVVLPFPFPFAMETWYVRTSPFSAFT